MLFEHNHRYAGAGEQHPEHHAGGTAAGNATCGSDDFCVRAHSIVSPPVSPS